VNLEEKRGKTKQKLGRGMGTGEGRNEKSKQSLGWEKIKPWPAAKGPLEDSTVFAAEGGKNTN